jgi:quinolinate synthase
MQSDLSNLAALREDRNAVILAHNYQRPEIQDIADYVGDSLGLAEQAMDTDAETIVFCGVDFMAESAKVLNPQKIVLHPDRGAKCPMAAMVNPDALLQFKQQYDMDVVSYVNTTAAVKAVSDICCTSANAVKVVKAMDNGVIFVPDANLGRYVQRFTDKEIILWPGFCPTHEGITTDDVQDIKRLHPSALVVAHPECPPDVIDTADEVTSTTGMLNFARRSDAREFIVVTEKELAYRMKKELPEKTFYVVEHAVCPTMKKITVQKVIQTLKSMHPQVTLDEKVLEAARRPLKRMMEVGR